MENGKMGKKKKKKKKKRKKKRKKLETGKLPRVAGARMPTSSPHVTFLLFFHPFLPPPPGPGPRVRPNAEKTPRQNTETVFSARHERSSLLAPPPARLRRRGPCLFLHFSRPSLPLRAGRLASKNHSAVSPAASMCASRMARLPIAPPGSSLSHPVVCQCARTQSQIHTDTRRCTQIHTHLIPATSLCTACSSAHVLAVCSSHPPAPAYRPAGARPLPTVPILARSVAEKPPAETMRRGTKRRGRRLSPASASACVRLGRQKTSLECFSTHTYATGCDFHRREWPSGWSRPAVPQGAVDAGRQGQLGKTARQPVCTSGCTRQLRYLFPFVFVLFPVVPSYALVVLYPAPQHDNGAGC